MTVLLFVIYCRLLLNHFSLERVMDVIANRLTRISECLAMSGLACEMVTAFDRKSSSQLLRDRKDRLAYLRTPRGKLALRRARQMEKKRRALHKKPDPKRSRLMMLAHRAYE